MALARTASGNDMESVWEWIEAAKALKRQYVIFALDGKASTLLGEKGEPFFYEPDEEEAGEPVPSNSREGIMRAIAMTRKALRSGQSLLLIEDHVDLYRKDFWLPDSVDLVFLSTLQTQEKGCDQQLKPGAMALRSNKKVDLFLSHLWALLQQRETTLAYATKHLAFHSAFTPILSTHVLPLVPPK